MVPKKQLKSITEAVKVKFHEQFGVAIRHQDKPWAPHTVCSSCHTYLYSACKRPFPFVEPMRWMEPKNHDNDCYFCNIVITGFNTKNKKNIEYPVLTTTRRPILLKDIVPANISVMRSADTTGDHSGDFYEDLSGNISVVLPENANTSGDISPYREFAQPLPELLPPSEPHSTTETPTESMVSSHEEFLGHSSKFTQPELNNTVRRLNLSKDNAELLGSILRDKDLLATDTKISLYRHRETEFRPFFKEESNLVYCPDVKGLMEKFGINYKAKDWRIFIDSSKTSLKVVLLNNGNFYAPIPIGYSSSLKENYETLELIIEKIEYKKHNWAVCGDLKIISMILGQQGGYTKNPCFMCTFDSRDLKENHWKHDYYNTRELVVGEQNVKRVRLVEPENIILPPLHIKLGIMKQFVKALPKDGPAFLYLKTVFPKLSDAKIKEGVFTGPDIRKLMKCTEFQLKMKPDEKKAWQSFRMVIENFLGNHKSPNYKFLVNELL